MAKPLSPAAQAVLTTYEKVWSQGYGSPLAAALRAAADQLYDSASQDYLWKLAAELEQLDD